MLSDFLWWRDGVIYQIYPRSYADSNGDGIGDLPGITTSLDYLRELGVDAIWLSPIYPSPNVDFGYDVSDYCAIDPVYGSMADFDALLAEAHRRGIRVILDLVLNHTSDQHAWFQQSRAGKDNPYRDWYIWRPPKAGGGPPNNWQSVFGGSAWQLDPTTGEYYLHYFYKEQPDVNWHHPAVRKAMLDVFRFWLDKGVDGFRLDVFNLYFKSASLEDNPRQPGMIAYQRQRHVYDVDRPEMLPLLAEIRALLDSYPERYMVGETFLDNSASRAASYCGDDRLHAAFFFGFMGDSITSNVFPPRWSAERFKQAIVENEAALAGRVHPNYVLNNHDVVRSTTRFKMGEDDTRAKVAAAMLLTLRGTPFLYYGEEIGMRDIRLRKDQILDLIGRRYYPLFKGRDGCRSPMQWDASRVAGFSPAGSTSRPWLPLHPGYAQRNVAAQKTDPNSLLNFYHRLIRIRRATTALTRGDFGLLSGQPRGILAYLRHDRARGQVVLVALNFTSRVQTVVQSGELAQHRWRALLSGSSFTLPPNGVSILIAE